MGEVRGVVGVSVSLKERRGTVEYDSAVVAPEEIKNTVEDMGFIVTRDSGMYHRCCNNSHSTN